MYRRSLWILTINAVTTHSRYNKAVHGTKYSMHAPYLALKEAVNYSQIILCTLHFSMPMHSLMKSGIYHWAIRHETKGCWEFSLLHYRPNANTLLEGSTVEWISMQYSVFSILAKTHTYQHKICLETRYLFTWMQLIPVHYASVPLHMRRGTEREGSTETNEPRTTGEGEPLGYQHSV